MHINTLNVIDTCIHTVYIALNKLLLSATMNPRLMLGVQFPNLVRVKRLELSMYSLSSSYELQSIFVHTVNGHGLRKRD